MIDTTNKFMVALGAGGIIIMRSPPEHTRWLNYDDALLLAAYLVAMAEPHAEHKFEEVLKAVQNA